MTNNFLTKSADIRLQITKARIRLIVTSGVTGGKSHAQRFRINMKRAVKPIRIPIEIPESTEGSEGLYATFQHHLHNHELTIFANAQLIIFMSLFGSKMLCNLLCQPDKLL